VVARAACITIQGGAKDIPAVEEEKPKIMLQKNEYIRLVDTLSGFERVVRGPATLVPEPLERAPQGKEQAIIVGATNAVLVLNKTTGVKSLITQEGMFMPGPYQSVISVQEARLVEMNQYAVVKDHLSGNSRNELGPKLLQVGAYEELLEVKNKVMLQKDEYLRLLDKNTGVERILTGPQIVVPEPWEQAPDGKQQAGHYHGDDPTAEPAEDIEYEGIVDVLMDVMGYDKIPKVRRAN